VAKAIGQAMNGERIVITKSTVPVGTAEKVRAEVEAHTDMPVHVCSNPEFLKEGAAVDDFMERDRVVLGVDSARLRCPGAGHHGVSVKRWTCDEEADFWCHDRYYLAHSLRRSYVGYRSRRFATFEGRRDLLVAKGGLRERGL
jgi:UDP-glucose/GDP-mannose dehydrogenase family protein